MLIGSHRRSNAFSPIMVVVNGHNNHHVRDLTGPVDRRYLEPSVVLAGLRELGPPTSGSKYMNRRSSGVSGPEGHR